MSGDSGGGGGGVYGQTVGVVRGGATRAEAESQASVVMARELHKIDTFLSGAASDLGNAGLTIAHHVGTPGREWGGEGGSATIGLAHAHAHFRSARMGY